MIPLFIRIALRNFIKERFYSAINVLGLSVGIAVTLLISLFLLHETSYDRFHRNADRLYRIVMHLELAGNATTMNSTFPPMAEVLEKMSPEVEKAVRLYLQNGRIFKNDATLFTEDKVLYADSSLFGVFDFPVLAGNPKQALVKPYQVLLTPALAEKYFHTRDWSAIVGKSILVGQQPHEVTGIVEEAPANSHIHYTAIISLESHPVGRDKTWNNLNLSTYVLLRKGARVDTLPDQVRAALRAGLKDYDKLPEQGLVMEPVVQRMTDLHLHSNIQGEFEPAGSVRNLVIFGSVAVVVLLLASVNFINLVTARSSNRAKEVGVRKVLGSASGQLRRQFMAECICMVGVATLLALGIVELARYPFTGLSGKVLPFHLLLSYQYLACLGGFVVVLGILAGAYPAFFLSSFKPVHVLKGTVRAGFRGGRLRNILVTGQFVISMVLITCTLVVQRQLEFMRSRKLGFDKENVVVIDNANRLRSQQAFITALSGIPGVEQAGSSTFRPVDDYDGMMVTTEDDDQNRKLVNFSRVDDEYMQVMKYELLEGRNFSREVASDSDAVILNERAADLLFGGKAMGKKLSNGFEYTVIGVVRDFNFESLKNEVRPLIFLRAYDQRFLHVRISPGDYTRTIAALEAEWKKQTPDVPFSYAFIDETYNDLYREEVNLGNLFSVFTGLALFIACLGLMGLAAYTAEQRKKEISVRKVLGASVSQVVILLSKSFARIIAVALLLATPLAWYLMQQWLKGFAYRADIPLATLMTGSVIVVIIALLAVSYQAIRAALLNPVDSLKEE